MIFIITRPRKKRNSPWPERIPKCGYGIITT